MAASTIDETLPATVVLEQGTDTALVLRRRLLAEIMPSVLHELSQPLTCVLLQHAVSSRAAPSDPAIAADALAKAQGETRRAVSIVESMNLLSCAQAEPPVDLDVNATIDRAAELLRRDLYDRRCTIDYHLARLPLARFSPTTALETILRAIILSARSSCGPSRLSIATQVTTDGRFVEIAIRKLGDSADMTVATLTACSNYPHVARAIQSGGGRIDVRDGALSIALPIAEGREHDGVIDA